MARVRVRSTPNPTPNPDPSPNPNPNPNPNLHDGARVQPAGKRLGREQQPLREREGEGEGQAPEQQLLQPRAEP